MSPRALFVAVGLLLGGCGSSPVASTPTAVPTSTPTPTHTPVSYQPAQGKMVNCAAVYSTSTGHILISLIQLDSGDAYYSIHVSDFTPQPDYTLITYSDTVVALVYQSPATAVMLPAGTLLASQNIPDTVYPVVQLTINGQVYKTSQYPPSLQAFQHVSSSAAPNLGSSSRLC